MTDLYDALISDSWNRASPKIQAYAYAIKQAIQMVIDMDLRTLTYADIDSLSEETLDQLAADNRAMYYDETLPVEKKRDIVKRSLIWYGQAGTVGATKELLETIFGGGTRLVENPYGDPYTFDVETDGLITEEILHDIDKMLADVKNVRSHLGQLKLVTDADPRLYVGLVTSEIITWSTSESAIMPDVWPDLLTDENGTTLLDENGALLLDGG